MTAYILDLDGTFILYGTNKLAKGSAALASEIEKNGDQLFLITARKTENIPDELSIPATEKALRQLEIKYEAIIENCQSPRVLVNDEGAFSLNITTNQGLPGAGTDDSFMAPAIQRIHNSLISLAWSNARYGDKDDADDFVQTILVAESLLENQSFNHASLVSKFEKKHASQ